MALVVFIDTTTKSDSLISKFEREGHRVNKILWVDGEVVNKCNGMFEEKVLIWHVSSSKIMFDDNLQDVSIENISVAEKILHSCNFTHKFGVTDHSEQYKQDVRKAWDFNDVESWDELKERFKNGLQIGIEDQDKIIKTVTSHFLHLFLPLDIDMQTLIDEKVNKENYLQDMVKGVKELIKEEKKDFFKDKLKHEELKKLLNIDGKKQNGFNISDFVADLDSLLKGDNSSNREQVINQASKFTKWYIDLANALRSL